MRYYFIKQRMEVSQLPHTVLNRPMEVVNFPRVKMVKEIGMKAYGYVEYRKFISDVAQGLYGLAFEFGDLPLYHDGVTEQFIEKNLDELRVPQKMSTDLLTETLTYIYEPRDTAKPNVYERELARRAHMTTELEKAKTKDAKRKVIHDAAARFNIMIF